MQVRRVRDLTLVEMNNGDTLVIACDSCGSVGMKEQDALKVPPYFVGKLTSRVAIMEVICTGAQVIALADAVCNEMEPTGKEIIEGIKAELKQANIPDVALNGSTEENFPTLATGLGITAIGVVKNENLKVNRITSDCVVVSIGIPKVGNEIGLENDVDIVSYEDIYKLSKNKGIYEIVPVGSKGILHEALELAKANDHKFRLADEGKLEIDIRKSCGTSTVVLAAVDKAVLEEVRAKHRNVNLIGYTVADS